jgi:hypothetical protein
MGAPNSEVVYTSATTKKGGPQSLYGHVVALEKKDIFNLTLDVKNELETQST